MRRGFTLIELLIVVAIIAILAAIAVPNFLEAQMRSKIARVKSDFRTVATALESYRVDNQGYPPDWNGADPVYGPRLGPEGDWRTFSNLTTPIAYITSGLIDPFWVNSFDPNVPFNLRFYQYVDQRVVVYWQYAGWERWVSTGTYWLLQSPGPDGVGSNPWLGQFMDDAGVSDACYDATNGTKSRGDLGRSNVRSYPSN